jgi:hypothetical protein
LSCIISADLSSSLLIYFSLSSNFLWSSSVNVKISVIVLSFSFYFHKPLCLYWYSVQYYYYWGRLYILKYSYPQDWVWKQWSAPLRVIA